MSSNYQRPTSTTGRLVNTGPPRTNTGLTGLGAVGGPTGVGAGALRVIVEFLTQYDAEALKQLESQLGTLQSEEAKFQGLIARENRERSAQQAIITRITNLRQRITRDDLKQIKEIRDTERSRARGSQQAANAAKSALAQQTGLRKNEISLLVNEDRIRTNAQRRRLASAKEIEKAEQGIRNVQKQQTQVQGQLISMQNIRTQLLPKLGSLALGAAGGIFGGAIIGLGFAAANALIDVVGQGLKDLIDPANKAREVLPDVVESIEKLAEEKDLTFLDAAKEKLQDLGITIEQIDPHVLELARGILLLKERNEELANINEVVNNQDNLRAEELRKQILLLKELNDVSLSSGQVHQLSRAAQTGDTSNLNPAALQLYNQALLSLEDASDDAANAQARLEAAERRTAASAALAEFAHRQFADALNAVSNARIDRIQGAIDRLADVGPSQRTQDLQNQLEGIAEAQQQQAVSQQLINIQEQRAALLLKQRLDLTGQVLDYTKLDGQLALVAIDARIRGLQQAANADRAWLDAINDRIDAARKEDAAQDKIDQKRLEVFDERIEKLNEAGEAQDRLNKLLDLQYRMSQKIRREEGESIADFIARRANEQRQLLAEQADVGRERQISQIEDEKKAVQTVIDLANERREAHIEALQQEQERAQAAVEARERERQASIDFLNAEKDRIQTQMQLDDLAAQEAQINSAETTRKKVKDLQEQLQESQEADRKATESRRDALEQRLEAERERADEALRIADKEEQDRLRLVIENGRTMRDYHVILGELEGASRALADLQGYVKAMKIPPAIAESILSPIRDLIASGNQRLDSIIRSRYGGVQKYASGGWLDLTNGSSPFGQNIRFGEEGREGALIFSRQMMRALKENKRPELPPQSFVINRSDDPYRDKLRFGKVVQEAIERSMR